MNNPQEWKKSCGVATFVAATVFAFTALSCGAGAGTAAQCQSDNDCKGTRVCNAGQCVDASGAGGSSAAGGGTASSAGGAQSSGGGSATGGSGSGGSSTGGGDAQPASCITGRDTDCPSGFWCDQHQCAATTLKRVAEVCTDNSECAGSICLYGTPTDATGYCSKLCQSFAECPSFWECQAIADAPGNYCVQTN
jgi:hypothetical protein